jgi:hypothetical protein
MLTILLAYWTTCCSQWNIRHLFLAKSGTSVANFYRNAWDIEN